MFQELMPLLAQRILLLIVSRVNEEQISVNIIPKPVKSGQQEDGAALSTPLGITGTPKELDEQLPRQLVEFSETHLGLASTLKSAKEEMEAAAKASREAARKGTNSKSQSSRNATPGTGKLQTECVTKESSDDSSSPPGHNQPSTAGAGGGLDASTGSLFDLAAKNSE